MQCNSCGLHSDSLREFSRVMSVGEHRKTIDTIHLCPACRVMHSLMPHYVEKRAHCRMSVATVSTVVR